MPSPPAVLIVESDAVVAQDLVEALRTRKPHLPVIAWIRHEVLSSDLTDRLQRLPPIVVAMLALPTGLILGSGLAAFVESRGGVVFLLGGEDSDTPPNWQRIERPYIADDIAPLVISIAAERAGAH